MRIKSPTTQDDLFTPEPRPLVPVVRVVACFVEMYNSKTDMETAVSQKPQSKVWYVSAITGVEVVEVVGSYCGWMVGRLSTSCMCHFDDMKNSRHHTCFNRLELLKL